MKDDTQKQKISILFAPDVYQEMKVYADKHERSFNGEVMWALREYIALQKKEELRMQASVADVLGGLPLSAMREELRNKDMLFQTESPYATIQCIDLGTYRYSIDGQSNQYVEGFRKLLNVVPPESHWTADHQSIQVLMRMHMLSGYPSGTPFLQEVHNTMQKKFYEEDLPRIKEIGYLQWQKEQRKRDFQELVSRFEGGTIVDKEGKVCATLAPADYSNDSFGPISSNCDVANYCDVAKIEWIHWDEEDEDDNRRPTSVFYYEENSYSLECEGYGPVAVFDLEYGQCRADMKWESVHPSATTLVLKGEEDPMAIETSKRIRELLSKKLEEFSEREREKLQHLIDD